MTTKARPMSCYVTPPLEINYDFENESSSPVSDTFSENDISITPPSSVGTTPPTSPKSTKFGLLRKLSSKLSIRSKKSLESPKSIDSTSSSIGTTDYSSVQSTPITKRLSRDFSNLNIMHHTPKTPESPKRSNSIKESKNKRYSLYGYNSNSPKTFISSPIIIENPQTTTSPKQSKYESNKITRLSPIPNANVNYSFESSFITNNIKDQTLKLNIFFEELKSRNSSPQSVEDFDYFALKLRKDKLNNLNELINVIIYKLLAKKQDLNINDVKLLIFFKDKTLNPIVLKQSMSESRSISKEYQKPFDLNNDDLLLDYIKLKKKLYIMAQY
ncbi:hypothetical protein DFJ63DRAFT_206879 [Scheffersomyces coipomensis]|uniref:uncharacterized protein n=1 Tax=Scheffersomyces coipomensis TaxID=1788519 RepID=UPI00315D0052